MLIILVKKVREISLLWMQRNTAKLNGGFFSFFVPFPTIFAMIFAFMRKDENVKRDKNDDHVEYYGGRKLTRFILKNLKFKKYQNVENNFDKFRIGTFYFFYENFMTLLTFIFVASNGLY